jgi:twinkle protein
MQEESKFVKHSECKECGSSDANSLYTDGHEYCFSCQTWTPPPNKRKEHISMNQSTIQKAPIQGIINNVFTVGEVVGIPDRSISAEACKKYSVKVNADKDKHIYPYYDKDNNHVGNKIRNVPTKAFFIEGTINSDTKLFGENIFTKSGKYITITEGELDALSIYEMNGRKWPVVSVKQGAQSAYKSCQNSLKYLESFENIIICFDNDEPGKLAAKKVAGLFDHYKCKIVNLELKDANEYLVKGKTEEFIKLWWDAVPYTPAGIINLADLGNELYKDDNKNTIPYPWEGLNDKLYGLRTGELVTFTSGTGMGKSSILRELMHHLLVNTKDNVGILAMEESVVYTAWNLMSVEASQRLYIKEIRDKFPKEQLKAWEERTIGTRRFFAFKHLGSHGNEEILERVRFMAKALDCKWIFIDHLSILVSQDLDERRSIDNLMTSFIQIKEKNDVGIVLVSHLRRPLTGDTSFEDGREISISHLRGSQSIAQSSDACIALERNQQASDIETANTTTIRVLKNRYTGETGVACYLFYDKDTGRMSEIENPFNIENNNE